MITYDDVKSANNFVRSWVPCDAGSGAVLTNKALGASTDSAAVLAGTAWNDYDPANGEASVGLASVSATDLDLSTPFSPARNILGLQADEGDSVMAMLMVRFTAGTGAEYVAYGDAGGISNGGVLRIVRAFSGLLVVSEGVQLFPAITLSGTQVAGAMVYSKAVGGGRKTRRVMATVVVLEAATGAVVSSQTVLRDNQVADSLNVEGGYAMGDTMAAVGSTSRLFMGAYLQTPPGLQPDVESASHLEAVAIRTFRDAMFGHKDIPREFWDPKQAAGRSHSTAEGRLTELDPVGAEFYKSLNRPIVLDLRGTFAGTVTLEAGMPGGPFTSTGVSYTAPVSASLDVAKGRAYRLNFSTPTSGSPLYSLR